MNNEDLIVESTIDQIMDDIRLVFEKHIKSNPQINTEILKEIIVDVTKCVLIYLGYQFSMIYVKDRDHLQAYKFALEYVKRIVHGINTEFADIFKRLMINDSKRAIGLGGPDE